MLSGSPLLSKKKSMLVLSISGIFPSLMRWAFVIIKLFSPCLKIFVSIQNGITPLPKMSASTFPGPTLGSWSLSPTSTSLQSRGSAFKRLHISAQSTMETSSTITTSTLSGFVSLCKK